MILKYDFAPDALENKTPLNVAANLETLDTTFPDLDAIVLTSKDPFISEYVPLSNNPRYGVSGFTGSIGDAVYFTKRARTVAPALKPVALFVDGRYHLQADNETDSKLVDVVKLDVQPNIEAGIHKTLFANPSLKPLTASGKQLKVGIDYERTSVAELTRFEESAKKAGAQLFHVKGETVLQALRLKGWVVSRPIFGLPESATGRTVEKVLNGLAADLKATFKTEEVIHVTAATDDAAFLMNARGYHLPHVASVMAYTFFYKNELVVYLPSSSKDSEVDLDPATYGEFAVTVIRDNEKELDGKLKALVHEAPLAAIAFNGAAMNALLPSKLKRLFPKAEMKADYTYLLRTRARKTEAEMQSIRQAFIRSSRAIAKTLRWGKSESQTRKVSEVDLADYLYKAYGEEGAVALSFKTISGSGPNSAIVHYSTPSKTQYFELGNLALLDSGAYYSEGFCTDCTRGFFVGSRDGSVKPASWQKEIYTATLKSAIQVFIKPVDSNLTGKEVDAIIRGKVKDAGYDYMHGTGHGIGIHVHEDGIRLSTLSPYAQSPYACVSVEPGIYLKDQGGVRVENVALLQPHGKTYEYENVVFVGYDWDLVDIAKLTPDEKKYLKSYEDQCGKLGTQLTACPL
ncbi:MAG: M24 family metallopeptidase [Bdellovibrionales bacterium]|nr:M24 family metallopeptidase [Bdellovibrionales bacterium]